MLSLLLAGALGGLIRGAVGFIKYQFAYKNVSFKPLYIASMIAISGVIGLTVTWSVVESGISSPYLAQINPAVAFIVGYAGGDLIENLYKILVGKTSIYPLPKK